MKPQVERIAAELRAATGAKKCWCCGCFQDSVEALRTSTVLRAPLDGVLSEARVRYTDKRYDCLGCEVCWPANALNLAAELDPSVAEGAACPTGKPERRAGWPPLPGDYHVVRYRAPVAVCTLNNADLAERLADAAPEHLSVTGTLRTENLGIERLIRNILANPHIRFLILCGEDSRQAVGHLPGQSLISLFAHGIDGQGRIQEARGRRPVLKNVTPEQVDAFRRQVRPISLIGERDPAHVAERTAACGAESPGAFEGAPADIGVETIQAEAPRRMSPDPAGFFVIYPDPPRARLVVEHYTTDGVLDCVIEGATAGAVYAAAIDRKLLGRLDHAAYLGRELARAAHAMASGTAYVQDRAPGETRDPGVAPHHGDCGCGESACGKTEA